MNNNIIADKPCLMSTSRRHLNFDCESKAVAETLSCGAVGSRCVHQPVSHVSASGMQLPPHAPNERPGHRGLTSGANAVVSSGRAQATNPGWKSWVRLDGCAEADLQFLSFFFCSCFFFLSDCTSVVPPPPIRIIATCWSGVRSNKRASVTVEGLTCQNKSNYYII